MIRGRPILTAALLLGGAPAPAATYGDTLLAATLHRHPELAGIAIEAKTAAGPITITRGEPGRPTTRLPLANATGDPIGTVSLRLRRHRATGHAIAAELGRRIYVADNLAEPDPFVPGAPHAPAGQALVERTIDATPGLVTLALHVTPPDDDTNRIVASSFGRIGKAADKDDAHVIADGAVLREVTSGGRRVAIELPLRDRAGATIGALSTSFAIAPGADPAAVEVRAVALRDRLAAATPSLADLFARQH